MAPFPTGPGRKGSGPNGPGPTGWTTGANGNGKGDAPGPNGPVRKGPTKGSTGNGKGNGSANGFYGPRSNEMTPPLPSGPMGSGPMSAGPAQAGPQGFAGPDGLPQRRNGEQFRPESD